MGTAIAFEILDDRELDELLTEDIKTRRDKRLLCASCGHGIASRKDRMDVSGSHEHRFTNPHGISFRIGCFAIAKGCSEIGEGTAEWTWFSGYEWRIAVCRHCQTHVGWGYRSPAGGRFYGLILDRLVSPS